MSPRCTSAKSASPRAKNRCWSTQTRKKPRSPLGYGDGSGEGCIRVQAMRPSVVCSASCVDGVGPCRREDTGLLAVGRGQASRGPVGFDSTRLFEAIGAQDPLPRDPDDLPTPSGIDLDQVV